MRLFKASWFFILFTILLVAISCSTPKASSAEPEVYQRIYLVRHTEKIDDSRDPELSIEGKKRANQLEQILSDKAIVKIYSTDYKRTKQTGMPLADRLDLSIEVYDPSDLPKFADQLSQQGEGTFLVVGHSNSTPTLVNAILKVEKYSKLDHEEYNKLFIVDCDKSKSCTGRVVTF